MTNPPAEREAENAQPPAEPDPITDAYDTAIRGLTEERLSAIWAYIRRDYPDGSASAEPGQDDADLKTILNAYWPDDGDAYVECPLFAYAKQALTTIKARVRDEERGKAAARIEELEKALHVALWRPSEERQELARARHEAVLEYEKRIGEIESRSKHARLWNDPLKSVRP